MRHLFLGLACLVTLSACADGGGQVVDPRYRFDAAQPYGAYRAEREMALTGQGAIPRAVPRALPFEAPTPEQIAGPTAYQRVQAGGTALVRQPAAAARARATTPAGGGYYDPDTGRALASAPAVRAAAGATLPAQDTDALGRYAASQRHAPGTRAYPRSGGSQQAAARACARFPNPDAAQLMFLSAGGPQQDPMGMDPDGDGFVCGWNPAGYQGARS